MSPDHTSRLPSRHELGALGRAFPAPRVRAVRRRRSATRTAAALLGTVLFTGQLAAEPTWQVDATAIDGQNRTAAIAEVASESGDTVRVFRRRDGAVILSLRLRPGFERITADGCPTLTVLGSEPSLATALGGCRVDLTGFEATVGMIRDAKLGSRAVQALMQGESMHLTLRLQRVGYRHVSFSLRGSRAALRRMLGPEVRVLR